MTKLLAVFLIVVSAQAEENYTLIVDNALEDLAGNRIGRPFDVDTFERVSEHLSNQSTSLPFHIK